MLYCDMLENVFIKLIITLYEQGKTMNLEVQEKQVTDYRGIKVNEEGEGILYCFKQGII